ncbi:MAG: leucyl aminopeptidase family protein [Planctomycetota bacterium]
MPTAKYSIEKNWKPKSGDAVLFVFADRETELYDMYSVPEEFYNVTAPKEAGKMQIALAGKIKKADVVAFSVQLDDVKQSREKMLKKAVVEAIGKADSENCKRLIIVGAADSREFDKAIHEAAILGSYKFDKYLKKKAKPLPVTGVFGKTTAHARKNFSKDSKLFAHVNNARDILNEPGSTANPKAVAGVFRRHGKAAGMQIQTWEVPRLRKEKCNAILEVGRGSVHKPCMIFGKYGAQRKRGKHLVLVGKGLTFDTGGYSLKGGEGMGAMKMDMGGAAATWYAACAIAAMKLPIKMTVITPLVHNAIGANAYLPGDVIRTRSGRTVEVISTDAEGRLVLADALDVAKDLKPDIIVDAATLTGAQMVALGTDIAAVYGDDEYAKTLMEVGKIAGDNFWQMPLYRPYEEQLKTPIADVKNSGGRPGGSITAALFLSGWVPDKMRWLHLDIAGPAVSTDKAMYGKGLARGFGVKALAAFAERICK